MSDNNTAVMDQTFNQIANSLNSLNKKIDLFSNYTSFQVYANDTIIPSGTLVKDLPWEDEEQILADSLLSSSITSFEIPSGMTEKFVLRCTIDADSSSDVYVDWGDGSKSYIKNGQDVISGYQAKTPIKTVEPVDTTYYLMSHTYEVAGKYVVKVLGQEYYSVMHSYENFTSYKGQTKYNLLSNCFSIKYQVKDTLQNAASFAIGALRLIKVKVPVYHNIYSVLNFASAFQNCKNLIKAIGLDQFIRGVNTFSNTFNGCSALTTCDLRMTPDAAVTSTFSGCSNLVKDIVSFFPLQKKLTRKNCNFSNTFKGCSKLTLSSAAGIENLLWKDYENQFTYANAFKDCSEQVRALIPTSWGGTLEVDSNTLIMAKVSDIPTKTSELTNDTGYLTEHQDVSQISKNSADISALATRLSMVQDKVSALKKTNTEVIAATAQTSISVSDATKDFIVAGATQETINATAKTLEIKDFDLSLTSGSTLTNGNALYLNVSDEIELKNSSVQMDKSTSSNCIKVVNANSLTIKDVQFTGTTYNTIMTGQNCTSGFIKYMLIDNCNFNETCKHINIWFAGHEDNAILTISNCHFATSEQFLCLSDYANSNNKLTVNIINCTIDNYDDSEMTNYGYNYAGFILIESRNIGTYEQLVAANPYGDGKVVFNIQNLVVKGTKVTTENFKIATGQVGQSIYFYHKQSSANNGCIKYTEQTKNLFPTFNIK